MKFFLDTANLEEIREVASNGHPRRYHDESDADLEGRQHF